MVVPDQDEIASIEFMGGSLTMFAGESSQNRNVTQRIGAKAVIFGKWGSKCCKARQGLDMEETRLLFTNMSLGQVHADFI